MYEFLLDARIERLSERDEDWRPGEICPMCEGPIVYRVEGKETVRFCCRCQETFFDPGQLQRILADRAEYVVLVTGGRNFNDPFRLYREMNRLHAEKPIDVLVEGGAQGADSLARQWAQDVGIPKSITVRANWNLYSRAAGPMRNAQMLREYRPDVVVAFPGARGTADMIERAEKAGIRIILA